MTNEALLKFLGDKALPVLLIAMAGGAYLLDLPREYCAAVATAGFMAWQASRSNPTSPPQT